MNGIDVSAYQGTIDFKEIKADGIEIVYIKATQGSTYINPLLLAQYAGAKTNGLKIGVYHYLDGSDPILQVQHFIDIIKDLVIDCKYVVDIEEDELIKWTISSASLATRRFADYLISKGKEVMLYTGDYFFRDNLDSTVKDLPLWVARYGCAPLAQTYVGLQYSMEGRLAGITGNVDLDNFNSAILINKPIILAQEVKKVDNIVVVGNSVDKRAAEYLADKLLCPIIDASLPFDYSVVTNVYCVGGAPTTNGKVGWTSQAKKIITGATRYDTAQLVLDFIKTI